MPAKPAPVRSFSTSAASRISGVPLRTVDFWAKSGVLEPSIAFPRGIGSDRRYSLEDLYVLRALAGILAIRSADIQRAVVAAVRVALANWRVPAEMVHVPIGGAVQLSINLRSIINRVDEAAKGDQCA